MIKNPPEMQETACNDVSSITGLETFPEKGNDNPLQYSRLRNPMDRGAWQAIVYGVSKESDMTDQLTLSLFNHGTLLLLMNE